MSFPVVNTCLVFLSLNLLSLETNTSPVLDDLNEKNIQIKILSYYLFCKRSHFLFVQIGLTNDAFDELCDHLKNVTYSGEFLSLVDSRGSQGRSPLWIYFFFMFMQLGGKLANMAPPPLWSTSPLLGNPGPATSCEPNFPHCLILLQNILKNKVDFGYIRYVYFQVIPFHWLHSPWWACSLRIWRHISDIAAVWPPLRVTRVLSGPSSRIQSLSLKHR